MWVLRPEGLDRLLEQRLDHFLEAHLERLLHTVIEDLDREGARVLFVLIAALMVPMIAN